MLRLLQPISLLILAMCISVYIVQLVYTDKVITQKVVKR